MKNKPDFLNHCHKTITLNKWLDNKLAKTTDDIILETAVTLMIAQVGNFTIMCTPCEVKELAVGFMYTEGLLQSIVDIVTITDFNSKSNSIGIQLLHTDLAQASRNLIITSSCGFCGQKNIDKLIHSITPVKNTIQLSIKQMFAIIDKLYQQQKLQQLTGSAHAAGILNKHGELVAVSEDVGRHNALDKVIGKILLTQEKPFNCGLVLSGRVSFEMVAKAVKAGVEIIIAVSAPSSLAIEMAEHWNITLCGFAREQKINIYTHPSRIIDMSDLI